MRRERRSEARKVLLVAMVIALWLGLPMGAAWAEGLSGTGAGEGRTAFVLVGAESWLNIRERPKAHAPVVLRLTRGDALTLYRIDADGWAEVSRAGDPGYCRATYLCDALPTGAERMRAAAGKLNVRSAPAGDVLARLKAGAAVTVRAYLTDDDGVRWANIGVGFVMAAYLEPLSDAVGLQSTEGAPE